MKFFIKEDYSLHYTVMVIALTILLNQIFTPLLQPSVLRVIYKKQPEITNIELYEPQQSDTIYIKANSSVNEHIQTLFKIAKRDEKSIAYLKALIMNNKAELDNIKVYEKKVELLEVQMNILKKRK